MILPILLAVLILYPVNALDPALVLAGTTILHALAPNANSTCKPKLLHMLNTPTSDPELLALLSYSGKGINELGDFSACSARKGSLYTVLSIKNMPITIAIGICSPKECGAADMALLKGPVASLVNSVLSSGGSSPISKPLTAGDVEFVVPGSGADENVYGGVFWGFIVALGAILGVTLVATVTAAVRRNGGVKAEDEGFVQQFDASENFARLSSDSPEKHNPDLAILSGVRFLSMIWIVIGHTYYYAKSYPLTNPTDVVGFVKDFWNSYLTNATYSVDVFFFVSGFFAFYLVLSGVRAPDWRARDTWKFYIHRWTRMSPLYYFAMWTYGWVLLLAVDGPMKFKLAGDMDHSCHVTWPLSLLYVNNFAKPDQECGGWLWYVPNDMQFFLLVPIFAILYKRSRLLGAAAVGVVGIVCTIWSISVAYRYSLSASYMKFTNDYFEYYYDKPYARIAPYLLGVFAAMVYIDFKDLRAGWTLSFSEIVRNRPLLRYAFYAGSVVTMFWLVHSMYWLNNYPDSWSTFENIVYLVFNKAIFVVCFFLLIYPALVGRGWFLRSTLGNGVFRVLGKITYAAYMYHPIMMSYYAYNERKGEFFEGGKFKQRFFGYLLLGYGLSALLTPLVETPFRRISRKYLKPYEYPRYPSAAVQTDESKDDIKDKEEETEVLVQTKA